MQFLGLVESEMRRLETHLIFQGIETVVIIVLDAQDMPIESVKSLKYSQLQRLFHFH